MGPWQLHSEGGRAAGDSFGTESFQEPPDPPLPRPCARGCKNLPGAGSSARFTVRTCQDCGRGAKERRAALRSPGERPRDLVDNRGSIPDCFRARRCR
eukprot:7266925-Pyramimonas_sp.AAC.1